MSMRIEVETGEEGVQLARERRSALILMDIQLPGMNGIEALRELRTDPTTQAIPVIAVKASVMAQDRQRIMAAGFDGFQGKPISVRELLATMRAILDRSSAASTCSGRLASCDVKAADSRRRAQRLPKRENLQVPRA